MKSRIYVHTNTQNGFTLLFAMLVATMVVAIGASIISIAIRQTILSSTSRESQYAYYAASTGLNCAFYWDRDPQMPSGLEGKSVFKSYYNHDNSNLYLSVEEFNQLSCAGVSPTNVVINADPSGTPIQTTFSLQIKPKGSNIPSDFVHEYCAQVTVKKVFESNKLITTIESKGYNNCEPSSPRRVERGLIQQYEL